MAFSRLADYGSHLSQALSVFTRVRARAAGTGYGPGSAGPEVIENDYYRFLNQPCG
jgi:hypothetical protein